MKDSTALNIRVITFLAVALAESETKTLKAVI